MKITFWQNIQSFYQAPHMLALAREFGAEVTWVVEQRISDDRALQGWPTPDLTGVTCVVAPSNAEICQLCKSARPGDVHVLTGPRGFELSMTALKALRESPSTIGALTENRDDPLGRNWARKPLYRLDYLRFGHLIDFLLVMGYSDPYGGYQWFRRRGYRDSQLFPYGYFPSDPLGDEPATTSPNSVFQIIYVGQYIHRKGLDTLLRALTKLKELPWQLDLIGSGVAEVNLRAMASQSGIESKVVFHANMSNQAAMRKVAASDVLVLPSRFDGWGVVVNEALLRGVPVICSDRCGAKDLLLDPVRGTTFSAGSDVELSEIIRTIIEQGSLEGSKRAEIKHWARRISGRSAAEYLVQVINHVQRGDPRPTAPWMLRDGVQMA